MKNLISTVLLPLLIFLKFGELDAAGNPGPGSSRITGRGGRRPNCGPRPKPKITPAAVQPPRRVHDATVTYMDREVHFWLKADGQLEQASFAGMDTDNEGNQRLFGLLIGLDVLLGRPTVIYVCKNGTLMSVRAPKPWVEDTLEPSQHEWYIVNQKTTWMLHVKPVRIQSPASYPYPLYEYEPDRIELIPGGNRRKVLSTDIITKVEYPLGMTYCTYSLHQAKKYPELMGAFFPKPMTFAKAVELIC